MPSGLTITTFYDFTAATKQIAAQVNSNFANMRGHLIPFDASLTSSAHIKYDLGSTAYRWNAAFFRNNYFGETTTSWQVGNADDLVIKRAGTTKMTVNAKDWTTSALAASVDLLTTTLTLITGASLTIATNNRPVFVTFMPNSNATTGYLKSDDTNVTIALYINGVRAQAQRQNYAAGGSDEFYIPLGAYKFYDYNLTTGSNTYQAYAVTSATGAASTCALVNATFFAMRMR